MAPFNFSLEKNQKLSYINRVVKEGRNIFINDDH